MARLPARAARTFYNAADALLPPGPGGGDRDLLPALEAHLARRGPGAALGLRVHLALLEWQSRLRGRGGFSWRPRAERARLLRAWEASVLPPRRRAGRALRALVESLARQSREGA